MLAKYFVCVFLTCGETLFCICQKYLEIIYNKYLYWDHRSYCIFSSY